MKESSTKVRNKNTGEETILKIKINVAFLWDSAFIRTKTVFRNFVPRQLFDTWGFPALYFGLLTNEVEAKKKSRNLPSNQFTQTVKTASCQCITLES